MKKTLLLLIFSTCIFSAQAQWFSIGARAGYNTTFTPENYKEVFNLTHNLQKGFHAGVFARLGRTIYIQPEIMYNFSSYDSKLTSLLSELNIKGIKNYKVSTIDVPLLLGTSLINAKKLKLRIMAGPKLSFNAGSTKDIEDLEDVTNTIREARLGLDAGIGLDIWRLTLDIRYNLIQNLYNVEYQNINNNNELLHSIQASVGFRFGNNNKKKRATAQ